MVLKLSRNFLFVLDSKIVVKSQKLVFAVVSMPGKGVPYVSVRFKKGPTLFFKNFELTDFKVT